MPGAVRRKKSPKRSKKKGVKKKIRNGTSTFTGFPKETITFLAALERNNRKTWFDKNKKLYVASYNEPAIAFIQAVEPKLATLSKTLYAQPKMNGSLRRIYRDTRFSKDKRPYKTYLDIMFGQKKKKGLGAALFLRIDATSIALGLGAYGLEGKDLDRYRKAVDRKKTGEALVKIAKKMEKAGFEMSAPHYKRVPRGYDGDHPRERWLRHTSIYTWAEYPIPRDLHSKRFVSHCMTRWKKMKPLLEWIESL